MRKTPSPAMRSTRLALALVASLVARTSGWSAAPPTRPQFARRSSTPLLKAVGQANSVRNGVSKPAPKAVTPLEIPTWGKSVGNTPLIDLGALDPSLAARGIQVFGKLEFMNPSGSIKDRIVEYILDSMERTGRLRRGSGQTVVAASSGNTAASLAMFCAMRGYKCILITNKKTSKEKVQVLSAYGAEVVVTASGVPIDSPEHYQNVEKRLVAEHPDEYIGLNQYDNPLNPEAYYNTLGPEIWMQTKGQVTHFVAAGSTGGTITGTSRFLKQMNPDVKSIMPDPIGSIFYEKWKNGRDVAPRSFEVEGVGKDSIPLALDLDVVDEMPRFTDKQAFKTCRTMATQLGMMAGGSAGGNTFAALQYAQSLTQPACIVVILCDAGAKYLSKIYNDDWMEEHNMLDEEEDEQLWEQYQVGSRGDVTMI